MAAQSMKSRLAGGQPAFGLSVMISSPQLVEMAAGLGFDSVLIDCEHGTIGVETMEQMVMAAEAAGITPIVRPRSNSAADIVAAMDRGASTRSSAWTAWTCSSSALSQSMGHPGEPKAPRVAKAIDETPARIVAATPGMPASTAAGQEALGRSVRYI